MRLTNIPKNTSTGRSRKRPLLSFTIGFGRLNPSGPIFKPGVPAKAKKKSRTINIRLVSGEDGLLKMYVD